MKVIKAQKIPKSASSLVSSDELLARFCLNYPQYKFSEAKKLPYKRVILMLTVAEKEYARKMYNLMQMIAAPHTKKGVGIRSMLEYYKRIMEGKNG